MHESGLTGLMGKPGKHWGEVFFCYQETLPKDSQRPADCFFFFRFFFAGVRVGFGTYIHAHTHFLTYTHTHVYIYIHTHIDTVFIRTKDAESHELLKVLRGIS